MARLWRRLTDAIFDRLVDPMFDWFDAEPWRFHAVLIVLAALAGLAVAGWGQGGLEVRLVEPADPCGGAWFEGPHLEGCEGDTWSR